MIRNMIDSTAQAAQTALGVPRERPFGVTLLAIFFGVSGGLYLFLLLAVRDIFTYWYQIMGVIGFLLVLFIAQKLGSMGGLPVDSSYLCATNPAAYGCGGNAILPPASMPVNNMPLDPAQGLLVLFVLSVLALLYLALARGLWVLDARAYWGTIVLQVVFVVLSIILFNGYPLQLIASCYVPVLIILSFLVFRGVRQAFRLPF